MCDENVCCMLPISVIVSSTKAHICLLVHVYAEHIYRCLPSHLQLHSSVYGKVKYNIYIFQNFHSGSHTLLAIDSLRQLHIIYQELSWYCQSHSLVGLSMCIWHSFDWLQMQPAWYAACLVCWTRVTRVGGFVSYNLYFLADISSLNSINICGLTRFVIHGDNKVFQNSLFFVTNNVWYLTKLCAQWRCLRVIIPFCQATLPPSHEKLMGHHSMWECKANFSSNIMHWNPPMGVSLTKWNPKLSDTKSTKHTALT